MPEKKSEEAVYNLASPPAHPVVWKIWIRADPSKSVLRESKAFFIARAQACAELGADPQSLDGEIVDDRPPAERESTSKKVKRKRLRSTSSKRRSKS